MDLLIHDVNSREGAGRAAEAALRYVTSFPKGTGEDEALVRVAIHPSEFAFAVRKDSETGVVEVTPVDISTETVIPPKEEVPTTEKPAKSTK